MSTNPAEETCVAVKMQRAHRYNVVFHNDDVTSFDVVVAILLVVFDYTTTDAIEFARTVHFNGRAIAGTFSKDLAETLKDESLDIASKENSPHLTVTVEKA